ncbi:MAG TPA: glycosyltransferase, partial [Solirubrobacteraceae bacterium]|nr:glycosyltransferase [Solirubrobacteraceae bacterium]
FAGPQAELEEMVRRLGRMEIGPADEVVLVDNRPDHTPPVGGLPDGVVIVHAGEVGSSWYARDAGVRATRAEWLLFIDADTVPAADLLDRYFDVPPAGDVGVLAGGVRDWTTSDTSCARYITARRKMDQQITLSYPYRPYAQTANCLVRRSAFAEIGGFPTHALSAGDADLCWRLQDAGWGLESRPDAYVDHENRTQFYALFRQLARHGAGLAWLERRYAGSAPPPTVRDLVGRIPHYLLAAVRAPGREEAFFALVDLVSLYARDAGRLHYNRARPRPVAAAH